MVKAPEKAKKEMVKSLIFPFILLLLAVSSFIFYKVKLVSLLSSPFNANIKKYIITILVLCFAFVLQRILGTILNWYKENVSFEKPSRLDKELIPFFKKIIKIGIWIIALLVVLPLYGVNISVLIATLGVGSLAIALAAQDTIANIIAGFLIMIDRPFRIGDKIKLPTGEIVTVLDIEIRRSKFLSEDKAIIIVPNVDLSKSKIVNYTYGEEL